MPSAAGGIIDRSVGHSAFRKLPTVPQPTSADFVPQITFRIPHSAFPQITNTHQWLRHMIELPYNFTPKFCQKLLLLLLLLLCLFSIEYKHNEWQQRDSIQYYTPVTAKEAADGKASVVKQFPEMTLKGRRLDGILTSLDTATLSPWQLSLWQRSSSSSAHGLTYGRGATALLQLLARVRNACCILYIAQQQAAMLRGTLKAQIHLYSSKIIFIK